MSTTERPSANDVARRDDETPLLEVRGLRKHFPINTGLFASIRFDRAAGGFPLTWDDASVKAVDGVDFSLYPRETFGVVGESGCGKSTLARTIVGLEEPTAGEVRFDGRSKSEIPEGEFRGRTQMVFQDPHSSLNPRRKVGHIIEDPLRGTGWPDSDPSVSSEANVRTEGLGEYTVAVSVPDDADLLVDPEDDVATVEATIRRRESVQGEPIGTNGLRAEDIEVDVPWGFDARVRVDESTKTIDVAVSVAASTKEIRRERALELLEQVGLKREYYNRYPHEFSGGQRQRINLARAISINPDLVIADEPVSGLDVSIQAQILNLMDHLQEEFGLTYLVISHDLSVVRYIADRVAVMYLGEFVEVSPAEELFVDQYHPYAHALLSAVPNPDPKLPGVQSQIGGNVPSASDPPRACRFHTRCPEFILPDGFSRDAYEDYVAVLEDVREQSLGTNIEETIETTEEVPARARSALSRAAELVEAGDWSGAAETLGEHESICQAETPVLESTGEPERLAACHLPFDTDGPRHTTDEEVTDDGP